MKAIHKKMLFGGIVVFLGVGYLAYASVKSGWVYYVDVGQFAADPAYQQQRVKLCGIVAAEGLAVNPAALSARFSVQGQGKSVPVNYHGVIPDMFAAGREVVIEGKVDSAGVFQADQMMTKCASKYEAGKTHPAGIQRSGHERSDRNL